METEQKLIWWKDKKLLAGVVIVILSALTGFYGKALLIVKFYEPVGFLTGISIWAFSWLLLLLGIFLVGWETIKMIQYRIHRHVKTTVKSTYNHAKDLHKRSYDYTKKLHRKGMNRIAKTSVAIAEKIKND